MACLRVVFHLKGLICIKKNSNYVGSHHAEGFQDCFMYKEDMYTITV